MLPPEEDLSPFTTSAGSPPTTVAFFHGDSDRLFERTTLGVLFIWSIDAWSSPGGPDSQAGMNPSASLRPSTIVSTFFQMPVTWVLRSSVQGPLIQSISPPGPAM